jgi:hypothetical protein
VNRRELDAIDTLRRAVVEEPEAFTGRLGNLLDGDREMLDQARAAIGHYRGEPEGVAPTDAHFMAAALAAAIGDHDTALAAIRIARELGEDRPSGRALYRVLGRPVAPAPAPANGAGN